MEAVQQRLGLVSSHPDDGLTSPAPQPVITTSRVDATVSDADLWRRVQSGDSEAFGVVFDRYARSIYNYCFRQLGDWGAAEDITSIVFLEALRKREASVHSELLRPWLFGIATNVLRNARRAQRRHAAALARLPRDLPTETSVDEIIERVESERAVRPIVAELGRLRQDERDALALCVLARFSYEEAAAALNVPVGTIRSRVSRAKERLRRRAERSSRSLHDAEKEV
jgi:RNA polymerase sigma-70 factor (ECF subfamily)